MAPLIRSGISGSAIGFCRAAVSVLSNIAEGFERGSNQEFIQFLRYCLGSIAELRTQSYLAVKLNKIESSHGNRLIEEMKVISAQLVNLMKYRKQKQ